MVKSPWREREREQAEREKERGREWQSAKSQGMLQFVSPVCFTNKVPALITNGETMATASQFAVKLLCLTQRAFLQGGECGGYGVYFLSVFEQLNLLSPLHHRVIS